MHTVKRQNALAKNKCASQSQELHVNEEFFHQGPLSFFKERQGIRWVVVVYPFKAFKQFSLMDRQEKVQSQWGWWPKKFCLFAQDFHPSVFISDSVAKICSPIHSISLIFEQDSFSINAKKSENWHWYKITTQKRSSKNDHLKRLAAELGWSKKYPLFWQRWSGSVLLQFMGNVQFRERQSHLETVLSEDAHIHLSISLWLTDPSPN